MNKLIVIKTFRTRAEAELAKNFLAGNGIKAVVASDGSGLSHVTLFSGPTDLLVRPADKAEATAILKENNL